MVRLTLIKNAKVGFIGCGNMGASMVKNLMKKGHQLKVLDTNKVAIQELVALGAFESNTPAQIAAESDVIITMLPAHPQVLDTYTRTDGILSTLKKSTVCIDCSTIDIEASKEIAKMCEEKQASFSDAPVSGGTVGAAAGTLTFMVGTKSKESFEAVKPVLQDMGKNIVHVGENGHGLAAKICNNMLLGISMIGVAETMNLGINLGLDKKVLANILNTSTGRCWASDTNNPVPGALDTAIPSNRDYAGGFGVGLIAKDLSLAQKAASDTKSATNLGSMAYNIYKHLTNKDFGMKDFGFVYKYIKNEKN